MSKLNLKHNLIILLILLAYPHSYLCQKQAWELRGTEYESQTAAAKYNQLWNLIKANQQSHAWLGAAALPGFLAEKMDPTLKWVADTVPFSAEAGMRQKFTHTVGVHATCEFVPTILGNQYTGIFQGAQYGIIRFSTGPQPDETKVNWFEAIGNFAPGFAIKFLRDGVPSVNLLTLTAGFQTSWNFFGNSFSNHILPPAPPIGPKFREATQFIQHLGLSHAAAFDESGVPAFTPRFPFQLLYEAPQELKNMFTADFEAEFTEQLMRIKCGQTVFRVFALASPTADKQYIGDIVLTSDVIRSNWGDSFLFFKHQDGAEDLALRSEWTTALTVTAATPTCPIHSIRQFVSSAFQQAVNFAGQQ
ncbi:UNKNOWN [Stylonychia lemnae]|uniref:Uncharacterized protein n=1 Tax=Stylonychia lemnae TaxID=5949 RepID=A0A077ZPE0_STYLE|nr:UNKNOWN [Stylonychia lemnae]|eukprot:CDW71817.1 UNKNOWN [Stylonychia lemnae]